MNEGRLNLRKKDFKKTIDEPRTWRDDTQQQLRKNQRMESLAKRRGETEQANIEDTNQMQSDFCDDPIETLVEWIKQDQDKDLLYKGLKNMRYRVANLKAPKINEILDAGALPYLVELLSSTDIHCAYETCWIITNISSGTSKQTIAVIEANALPPLMRLIREGDAQISEQALWCMGNFAGDCADMRDMLINMNLIDILAECIQRHTKLSFLANAAWVTSNMLRHTPAPPMETCVKSCHILKSLLGWKDPKVVTDICWGLSYLTNSATHHPNNVPNPRVDLALEMGFAPTLIDFLSHRWDVVRFASLRTVGQIAAGTNAQAQALVDLGLVPALLAILKSTSKRQQLREIIWIVSNLCAGTPEQLEKVLQEGLLLGTLQHFDSDVMVKSEVLWSICNSIMNSTIEQLFRILSLNVLPLICSILETNNGRLSQTEYSVSLVLRTIDHMFVKAKAHSEETFDSFVLAFEPHGFTRLETLSGLGFDGYEGVQSLASEIILNHLPLADRASDDNQGNEWQHF